MGRGVGLDNQEPLAPVALTQWRDGGRAVAQALDLCGALSEFDSAMRVIIKPNLVEYLSKFKFFPYGICTTSVVIEALLAYLKDAGAKDITIAEAALENKDFDCGTKVAFEGLGYHDFSKRFGVKLMDLHDGEFEKVKLGGFSLSIAKPVLEADFLINVPVLKTHEQTKVSLGFKNNKGCLTDKSKQICHHKKRPIDEFVSRLSERLYPNLTLIDGIYALENGPMHMGHAHRTDLIIAGRDMFSCDCVGAYLMGFDPKDILCLNRFAERHNRSLKIDDIDVKGLDPADNIHKIKHIDDADSWYNGNDIPDFFTRTGVKGFRMPHPEQTLCTGCSMLFPTSVLMIIAGSMARKGAPYDDYELLGGKVVKPSGHAKKTFLLGDCIIAANRKGEGIQEAIPLSGCPASLEEMISAFNAHGIKCSEDVIAYYFNKKAKGYAKKPEMYSPLHYFLESE